MPTIIIDMTVDGHFPVNVSDEEFKILSGLEKKFGSIHDAMNKLPEDDESRKLCLEIFNRPPAEIKTFVFYC